MIKNAVVPRDRYNSTKQKRAFGKSGRLLVHNYFRTVHLMRRAIFFPKRGRTCRIKEAYDTYEI